jgi:hypothetical protein
MKKTIIFLVLFLFNLAFVNAHSGDTISVPFGTTPTIDGIKSSGEWNDAFLIQVLTNGFYNDIYIKHSATHLFVAFESPYAGSTGIYLDKLHNGGLSPQPDDIWIHGSAGPFEFLGNGSNTWQQQSSTSNWNFTVNTTNQLSEYQILLSKLGIASGTNTMLGVLFSFIDWSMSHTDEITWPSGGYSNCINPDSWANMIISLSTSINENTESINKISIYPNLATEFIIVDGLQMKNLKFEIYNIVGKIEKYGNLDKNNTQKIDISQLQKGVYLIKMYNSETSKTRKFIKK